MPRQRNVHTMAAIVAILTLLAGACGSDGSSETGDLPQADARTDEPASSGACLPDEPDCVDTLSDDAEPQDLPDDTQGEDRSSEIIGRWVVGTYLLPQGSLTNVVGDQEVFIDFGSDGSVSYHTGCNGGGTEYTTSGTYVVPDSALDDTPEGQAISLGPSFEQTEIGCEGFLGDQDLDIPANMAAATRFTLDGDTLRLADESFLIEATRSN